MKYDKQKEACNNCFWFIYFPPFVQKELKEEHSYHCAKDKWRGIKNPKVFYKKVCKLWKFNDNTKQDIKLSRVPKLVRLKRKSVLVRKKISGTKLKRLK